MTDQEHCVTINYVLCSSNFEDIIIIHPIDIDECDTNVNNDNYTLPTRNEICNDILNNLKETQKVKCQKLISFIISLTSLM